MKLLPSTSLNLTWLLGAADSNRGEFASFVASQCASLLQSIKEEIPVLFALKLPESEMYWHQDNAQAEKKEMFSVITEAVLALAQKTR